jgi:signal transduction histidine kinase
LDQKGYLYDLMVHDLRGPLSVVATTANSLLCKADRYGSLTESQEHCLRRIARNTKRAQFVLEEILDVARSEEHIFQTEYFLFEAVVKESLANALEVSDTRTAERLQSSDDRETVWQILEEVGITVEISGKYEKTPFFHDRRKIALIVENLVSNALKYRCKRMKIAISGEGDAMIVVSDDGSGIPEEEQGAVYGRFIQLSNADGAVVRGLGLGLYCVKMLVETMGGQIGLTSKMGSGTTFAVQIPLAQENKK